MKKLIVLLLVILLAFALCACDGGTSTTEAYIPAKIDADGTAFIPMMDGTVVSIKGDVEDAEITADRDVIVVLESDGWLYVTSPTDTTEKTTIATNAVGFNYLRSDGVIYRDEESEFFRYTFADAANVSLGTDVAINVAENTLSALIADNQGDIYILAHDSSERERIGTYDESCWPVKIADDCKMAVWAEKDENVETMHLYVNGEHHKLEEVDSPYYATYADFNNQQTFVAVVNSYSNNIYFTTIDGTEVVHAKLGSELGSIIVYTENDYLSYDSSKAITGLYVLTQADDWYHKNLYYVSMDGDREKMSNDITDIEIRNERIYYRNADGDLYTAKLDGSTLIDDTKISRNVDRSFMSSADGKYVYYIKDSNGKNSLYRYNSASSDEPEKIASNVDRNGYYLSTDGKTVVYLEDIEEIDDYFDCGTLKYSTDGSEPVKISTDVMATELIGVFEEGLVNLNSFAFEKYSDIDEDGNVLVNLVYFNGRETTTLATDVYYE